MEQTFTHQNNDNGHSYGVTTDEIMDFLKDQMATKDDLKAFATKDDLKAFATKDDLKILENKMDEGFSSLRSELRDLRNKVDHLEEKLNKFFQTETEDIGAFYKDIVQIKERLLKLEQQVQAGTV